MNAGKRILAVFLSATLLLTSFVPTVRAASVDAWDIAADDGDAIAPGNMPSVNAEGAENYVTLTRDREPGLLDETETSLTEESQGTVYQDTDEVTVIVELEGRPLVEYALQSEDAGEIGAFCRLCGGREDGRDIASQHACIRAEIQALAEEDGGDRLSSFSVQDMAVGGDNAGIDGVKIFLSRPLLRCRRPILMMKSCLWSAAQK